MAFIKHKNNRVANGPRKEKRLFRNNLSAFSKHSSALFYCEKSSAITERVLKEEKSFSVTRVGLISNL